MEDNIIFLEHVSKTFGQSTVLHDIELTVRRGELLTLLGPSGCGKSTLMRIIAGFEPATDGRVTIDGNDMTGVPPERRPVNMVFQRYALFPHLDVFDNVAFGPRIRKLSKAEITKQVSQALELVQLSELKNRWVGELSGGQAQRVALARALVNRPAVLLLDEPLAALDRKIRHQMMEELKRIHRETGTTFVFVTHDQDEAMILSDRVVLMDHGRIDQIDTPDGMYGRPKTLFCAKFFGENNLIDAVVRDARTHDSVMDTPVGPVIAEASDQPTGTRVTLSVRPEAITIIDLDEQFSVPNAVTGQVQMVDFIGSRIVYKVRGQNNYMFKCQEAHGPHGRRFRERQEVRLTWHSRAVVVLSK